VKKVSINDARKFSLERVQVTPLLEHGGLATELLCFEAGQQLAARTFSGAVNYPVLEGEALVGAAGERERLGKGRLLSVPAGAEHVVENAGGGLLVVLATRAV
jgi:quercetin dioxygenase-like cupin family protein